VPVGASTPHFHIYLFVDFFPPPPTHPPAQVKPLFAERFCARGGRLPTAAWPYRQRVVLLFQRRAGLDMALFAMYLQEYGDDAPPASRRCVYLSYLDSVKYFEPEGVEAAGGGCALRTLAYHELLAGYLAHAKARGFATMYIWACPPLAGDDYVWYCHPGRQKTPRSDRLREWYLAMLRGAQREGTVA
jgi:E1A/CREB-binding protein